MYALHTTVASTRANTTPFLVPRSCRTWVLVSLNQLELTLQRDMCSPPKCNARPPPRQLSPPNREPLGRVRERLHELVVARLDRFDVADAHQQRYELAGLRCEWFASGVSGGNVCRWSCRGASPARPVRVCTLRAASANSGMAVGATTLYGFSTATRAAKASPSSETDAARKPASKAHPGRGEGRLGSTEEVCGAF